MPNDYVTSDDENFSSHAIAPTLKQIFWQGLEGKYIASASDGFVSSVDKGVSWGYMRPNPIFGTTWPMGAVGRQIAFGVGVRPCRQDFGPVVVKVHVITPAIAIGTAPASILSWQLFEAFTTTSPASSWNHTIFGTFSSAYTYYYMVSGIRITPGANAQDGGVAFNSANLNAIRLGVGISNSNGTNRGVRVELWELRPSVNVTNPKVSMSMTNTHSLSVYCYRVKASSPGTVGVYVGNGVEGGSIPSSLNVTGLHHGDHSPLNGSTIGIGNTAAAITVNYTPGDAYDNFASVVADSTLS